MALVVGESLADIINGPGGEPAELAGGNPLNVAIGLQRLGLPARLHTRIGRDRLGAVLRSHLEGSQVTVTAGTVARGPTSTATARLRPDGSASYKFAISAGGGTRRAIRRHLRHRQRRAPEWHRSRGVGREPAPTIGSLSQTSRKQQIRIPPVVL